MIWSDQKVDGISSRFDTHSLQMMLIEDVIAANVAIQDATVDFGIDL